jgi:MoaA/NifB/PqqE/SkfB family radical SAM enzyme
MTAETAFDPKGKLLFQAEKLAQFAKGDMSFSPVAVEISPTNDCNAKCPWCAVAGTMIAVENGFKPIEDIRVGDFVYGHDGKLCRVTSFGNREVSEIYHIHCSGHDILVSGEHPFLTSDGWKTAEEIAVGDRAFIRVHKRTANLQQYDCEHTGKTLERGLRFRFVSIAKKRVGGSRVYNFSCEPSESYEANGFVVHNCFYVSSEYKSHHSKDELSWDVLKAALSEMAEMGVKAVTWTGGGDPSVYSHINEAIEYAASLNLKQGMFTNAYRPIARPDLLQWLRVTVTERFVITKHVAKYAEATKCGVNFNLSVENASEVLSMATAARDAKCAYFQIRPALADRWELQKPVVMPEYLKTLETDDFKIILTPYKFSDYMMPHGYPLCHSSVFVPFLWHDGSLSVCAYHSSTLDEFSFGNINQMSFKEIWNGEKRKKMLADGIRVIKSCQNCCKGHEANKVLAAIRGEMSPPDDVDFI